MQHRFACSNWVIKLKIPEVCNYTSAEVFILLQFWEINLNWREIHSSSQFKASQFILSMFFPKEKKLNIKEFFFSKPSMPYISWHLYFSWKLICVTVKATDCVISQCDAAIQITISNSISERKIIKKFQLTFS